MGRSDRLISCGHCGNKANCKVKQKYTQDLHNEAAEEHLITTWLILECPACNHLILRQTYQQISLYDTKETTTILYPMDKMHLTNIPETIQKEYEATLKVEHISSNACAVLARRTLEAVFSYENATGKNLMDKVNSLIKSERIPPLLADIAHLGRQIGNLGAHFTEGDATEADVTVMLGFLETILEYLYVIPAKVNAVKERLASTSKLTGSTDL